MRFCYGLMYKNHLCIGVAYFQILKIKLGDSLRVEKKSKSLWSKVKAGFADLLSSDVLLSGNSLVTGDYNIRTNIYLSADDRYHLLEKISHLLSKQRKGMMVTFIKDFFPDQVPSEATKKQSKLSEFSVQPNMIIKIRDTWHDWEDYLSDFKSKARVRVKRARKKLSDVDSYALDLEQIIHWEKRMHDLYMLTAKQAGFNLFYLAKGYFTQMKKSFGEGFQVYGYFLEGEMVSFYSTFDNGDSLEAHFLGYNHGLNAKHQLYLNMILDLVHLGISRKFNQVHMSRTALEIKSSIGAHPVDMAIYLRHNSDFWNRFVPRALDYFVPREEWTPRNPFKN